MLDILLYRSSQSPPLSPAQFVAIAEQHGAVLRAVSDGYYCGQWQDPQTKASIDIDIGRPPLVPPGAVENPTADDDPHAEPKEYEGWQACEVTFHLPLTGPHWYAVEVAMWLEGLLKDLDGCGILLSEDVGIEGEPGYGPGAVDRPRLLACWEGCHGEQTASLRLPRMDRRSSLALWRYRKEQAHAAQHEQDLLWPQAMVLGEGERAVSTAVWPSADSKMALPDIDYVVIQRENAAGVEAGLVPSDEVRALCADADELGRSGAIALIPSDKLSHFFAHSKLIPVKGFGALHDLDWSD